MIETACLILGSILGVSVIVVKVFVKQTNMFYLLAIKALDTAAEYVQSSLRKHPNNPTCRVFTQLTFTCSTIKTLIKGVKYVQG